MLLYLSDVDEGGETVFPSSPEKPVGTNNRDSITMMQSQEDLATAMPSALVHVDREIAHSLALTYINPAPVQHVGNPSYSTCAQQGIAVKPKMGDALLFFSQVRQHKTGPASVSKTARSAIAAQEVCLRQGPALIQAPVVMCADTKWDAGHVEPALWMRCHPREQMVCCILNMSLPVEWSNFLA